MVEECGGTVKQCWWNNGKVMVEKWKYGGGTVLLEQWNSEVEQCWWNGDGGTAWWNSGTVLVEQWNSLVKQ